MQVFFKHAFFSKCFLNIIMNAVFILGDTLLTNYDVAIAIFSVCKTPESEKMKNCISSYVNTLIDTWTKAFGDAHVKDRRTITDKVKQVINHYKTHVYNEKNRTKPKKKETVFVKKSIRILIQEWRQMSMKVTKNRKPMSVPINDLLNCGKDIYSLTGIEKDFYISESIDVDYATEKAAELNAVTLAAERDNIEEQHALGQAGDEYDEIMNSTDTQLDVSLNRSEHARSTASTIDFGVQHDSTSSRPKITKMQNCTSKVCAEVSVKCNISSQASLVAVQTVCSNFYEHQYYLTKDEAIEKDPSLEEMRSKSTSPKPPKRSKSKSTVAHTTKEWKAYEHVLPSTKTINNHKHVLAIHHEQDAAAALYQIQPGMKVTLHYGATSRSKIDEDWPTLILIFSDKRRFPLRQFSLLMTTVLKLFV